MNRTLPPSGILFLFLASVLTSGASEEPTAEPVLLAGPVYKTALPPKIDGVLDEACWKKAEAHGVNFIMGKMGVEAERTPMDVKYTWDDHYFYIGYETFDENLVAIGEEDEQGPSDNRRQTASIWSHDPTLKIDVAEFFITFGDQHLFWELHHNALNHFSDVLIIRDLPAWKNPRERSVQTRWNIYFGHREYLEDEGPIELPDKTLHFKLATAVKLKPKADGRPSTPNQEGDKDAGYTAELRVPWHGLGAALSTQTMIELPPEEEGGRPIFKPGGPWKMAGRDLWVIAVCQNADLKDRYHHSGEHFKGGWFHHGVKAYPRFKLVDGEAKPE